MNKKIPPFISPAAVVSIVLALSATNLVVNKVTNTSEGAPNVSSSSSGLVINHNDDNQSSYSNPKYTEQNNDNVDNSSSNIKVNVSHNSSSIVKNYNNYKNTNMNTNSVQPNQQNNTNVNGNLTN